MWRVFVASNRKLAQSIHSPAKDLNIEGPNSEFAIGTCHRSTGRDRAAQGIAQSESKSQFLRRSHPDRSNVA